MYVLFFQSQDWRCWHTASGPDAGEQPLIITSSEQAVINTSSEQPVVNSASDQPVVISDALASFFGTEEKEMLQPEALKRVLDYIKDNQLEVSITLVHKHELWPIKYVTLFSSLVC